MNFPRNNLRASPPPNVDSGMTPHDEKLVRELALRLAEEAETKRVFKEAINEWMEHKYAEFGKWSLNRILVMLCAAFVVFVMWTQGYHK